MSAIGIDLGSTKSVMGAVKKGGIEIVLSDTSARSVPSAVAYTTEERLAGESVKTQIRRNFKNSILFPTRFIGLNTACHKQLAIEKKFTTHKIVNDSKTNKISFAVENMGTMHNFTVEQVLALYLTKLKEFYDEAGESARSVVLTVPSYASTVERQSLYDAVEIAGLTCPRIINESTAIAYNYGFFKRKDFVKDKPRAVAFVDFGHAKTTITIAKFEPDKIKIVCHHSDRNLGARDFDYIIFDKLGDEFDKKYGCDPREAPRCRLRILEAVEKARKLLTADTVSNINVDYLMEEQDLIRELKRDEFEQLIEPVTTRLKTVLDETIQMSGMSTDDIHFVELVGDATRTPILQEIIKEAFKKETLSRTLNALECIARGASLQAAILSPSFNVADIAMEDYNAHPVSITYSFADKPDAAKMTEIFPKGSSFPMTKSLTFKNKMGNCNVLVHYPEGVQLMEGLPLQLASYKIHEGKRKKADKNSKCEFVIKIINDIHQIARLESAEVLESWTELEQIPIKKPAPPKPAAEPKPEAPKEGEAPKGGEAPKEGEAPKAEGEKPAAAQEEKKAEPAADTVQEYETKERKRSTTSSLKYDTSSHAIPPDQKSNMRTIEESLYKEDQRFFKWKKYRNDLEAYAYDMRNNLEDYGSFVNYCEPAARTKFLADITAVVEWIYGEGENASFQEYETRLKNFREQGEAIRKRCRFHQAYPDTTAALQKCLASIQSKLNEHPHITDENRQSVIDKCQTVSEFFTQFEAGLKAKKTWEDPTSSNDALMEKIEILDKECQGIFKIPPPKPHKEAPTEEEKKAAEGEAKADGPAGNGPTDDVEMKDQTQPDADAPLKKDQEKLDVSPDDLS